MQPRCVPALVSAVDFFPTIVDHLAIADKPEPPPHQDWRPLTPFWTGGPVQGRKSVMAHTRWLTEPDRSTALVTDDGWKLVEHARRTPQLYFLREDPDEKDDLWGKNPVGDRLLSELTAVKETSLKCIRETSTWEL